jgi:hypothetical protein
VIANSEGPTGMVVVLEDRARLGQELVCDSGVWMIGYGCLQSGDFSHVYPSSLSAYARMVSVTCTCQTVTGRIGLVHLDGRAVL